MGGLFDRIFGGRSRALTLARSAELRGDLRAAEALFERAGRPDEVTRLRRSRALAVLATAAGAPVTSTNRDVLLQAGVDLEALGDFKYAAEAYSLANDVEAQAGALARAGDIERLDDLLEEAQTRDHAVRARRVAHEEFALLVAEGRRREAFAMASASGDGALRERGRELHARRVRGGGSVPIVVRGKSLLLVRGERIFVGRAPEVDGPSAGAIAVPSAALSRRHLAISRQHGEVCVEDLGSHNGTRLGGRALVGRAPVGQGIELVLGGEVSLAIRPTGDLPDAIAVEVAGVRYVAPLGPARLGIPGWRLECVPAAGVEDWLELAMDEAAPAFDGDLRLARRVALLVGDRMSTEAGGEAAVRFEESF